MLVTLMGNSLGLVRGLKSAECIYSGQIVNFLPDPDDLPEFDKLVSASGFKVNI